jgi:serine protease
MRLRLILLSAAATTVFGAMATAARGTEPGGPVAAPAAGPGVPAYVPGEVIVHYDRGVGPEQRRAVQRRAGARFGERVPGGSRRLLIRDGESVGETVAELRGDPRVRYVQPNHVVRAAFTPNDPGRRLQWNFFGANGVGAAAAWDAAIAARAPGGRGVRIAVIDSGVAYENRGEFRKAPDLAREGFLRGYDFVDRDRYANDENGHGTHVAGTIAQRTNNRVGVTGLAYGARILPLRVLDSRGIGDSLGIARALRYAARRRVDVANISVELEVPANAAQVPELTSATRYAQRRGLVIVSSSGNSGARQVNFPAAAPGVISVGAITIRGCQANYSNTGTGLDIVAPGGGGDATRAETPAEAAACRPGESGPPIVQQTFRRERAIRNFGLPRDYVGTSFAAPHVSAAAALIIATRRVGRSPSPALVEQRLKQSARDLGPEGYDERYGYGALDAAAALAR